MDWKRKLAISVAAVLFVVAVCGITAITILQSNWLKNRIRDRIVETIEHVTGGRVEIGAVHYNWRRLTFRLDNFVVRGTEPSGSPPLFKADSINAGLTIGSLWRRHIDVDYIDVLHPAIYLLFLPNGTSNIPSAIHSRVVNADLVEQLLNFRVNRYAFRRGTVQINLQRYPFDLEGSNLTTLLAYNKPRHSYSVQFSSHTEVSGLWARGPTPLDLTLRAQLEQNQIVFQNVSLRSPGSTAQASGVLQNFADPKIDLNLQAKLAAPQLAVLLKTPELRAGEIILSGRAHFDRASSIRFAGRLHGTDLRYRAPLLTASGVTLDSNVEATRAATKFDQLHITALRGVIEGQLETDYRNVQFDGNANHLNLSEISAAVLHRPAPWAAFIGGPVQIRGAIANHRIEDAVADGVISIAPGRNGIPLAGNLSASYRQNGNLLRLADVHLAFPHSQLAASGIVGKTLQVSVNSADLQDFQTALAFFDKTSKVMLPIALHGGQAQFSGTVDGWLPQPRLVGSLSMTHFQMDRDEWNDLQSRIELSPSNLRLTQFSAESDFLRAQGSLNVALANWRASANNALSVHARFTEANLTKLLPQYFQIQPPVVLRTGSGIVDLDGSLNNPHGTAQLTVDNVNAYGQHLNQIQLQIAATGTAVHITDGRIVAGPARVAFSGFYKHTLDHWRSGELQLRADSNGFPLASLLTVQKYDPTLNATVGMHAALSGTIQSGSFHLNGANGTATFANLTRKRVQLGRLSISAGTHGQTLNANISGALQDAPVHGSARVQLDGNFPTQGTLVFDHLDLSLITLLFNLKAGSTIPFDGHLGGSLAFDGSALSLDRLHARAQINHLQLVPRGEAKAVPVLLTNQQPILLEAENGIATIQNMELAGQDTHLSLTGSFPYVAQRTFHLQIAGSLNLSLLRLISPAVQSSGQCRLSATVGGSLQQPTVDGRMQIHNGLLYPNSNNLPDGLSAINGAIKFNNNRATIETLSAHSGGGEVSAAGFVSFSPSAPLVYRLEVQSTNVRFRYAGGASITANSTLRLTGTSANSLLSGNVTVTNISLNPNTDLGSLLNVVTASTTTPLPANRQDFVSGLQMDIHVESATNMQVNTALSQDIEADIDLRLRGKPSDPSVLGNISANQGNIKLFGATYSINRGEVSFNNPAKIEPVLDLDLQTQARGISVDISVSGTPGKLNINYRSDPPLQPRDIVALLTVGRAPDIASNVPNAQITNDASSLQSGANTVLGQAFSPVSNRLSKLFGITNIKIDPLVQGITNTPQARLTLQQQVSRDISVTYITNLAETSEQIFRFEWSINKQYSVIAIRDDNGEFGIDIQYKKRFK